MLKDFFSGSFLRSLFAEFLGTLFFVLLGLSSTLSWPKALPAALQISLTFGLAIATMVQTMGHISKAHLNPAVTVAFLLAAHISISKAVLYITVQVLGAVVGAGLLYKFTPSNLHGNFGVNLLSNGTSPGQGFAVEVLTTMQLVLCIFATTDSHRMDNIGSPSISIGLSVTLGHFLGIYFTGCSMNPARSFAPALITGNFTDHWVVWVGPMAGGIFASLIYNFILFPSKISLRNRLAILQGNYDPEREGDREEHRKQSIELNSMQNNMETG
ncbi:hypothetical protein XENTR_v10006866 [Xenopus tropicalis]|nr:hypothetical protein XENTR_v10006866 [Xenopus tropicalis]